MRVAEIRSLDSLQLEGRICELMEHTDEDEDLPYSRNLEFAWDVLRWVSKKASFEVKSRFWLSLRQQCVEIHGMIPLPPSELVLYLLVDDFPRAVCIAALEAVYEVPCE